MLNRVVDSCGIVRVQSWAGATVPARAEAALGVYWPRETGVVVVADAVEGAVVDAGGRMAVLCTGPTDWLVIGADANGGALSCRLAQAFEGSAFRVTDMSHALTRMGVEGHEVRDLLAKGCALDLHASRFAPGRAPRTRLAGMPVIVRCTGALRFECIVASSYAEYLETWLRDAALEFAVPVA